MLFRSRVRVRVRVRIRVRARVRVGVRVRECVRVRGPQARIGHGDARGLAFQGTGRVADLHHLPGAERDSGLSTSLSSAAPGKHLDSPGPVLGGVGSVCAPGGPPRAPDS